MYTKQIEKTTYGGDKKTVTVINYAKIAWHSSFAILAIILIAGSLGVVDAGERGVKVRMGNVVGMVEPGVYMKLPFFETVKKMNVRTQSVIYEKENPLTSASSDLQDVKIASVTNYHVDPSKVVDLYLQYRDVSSFEKNVIRPAVRDTVKATASQFSASELVTKRADFASAVATKLNERLSNKFIVVEQSNITNFEFSPSFSAAIEAKVTAVQNAEAAKNKLEQVKYEAEQQIVTAKATAEAQEISARALEAQGGKAYVELEAVKKWNGVLPTQMIPGQTVPFINLSR